MAPRQRPASDFMTAAEVAVRLGVRSDAIVVDLARNHLGFPQPVGRKNKKLIWSWSEVRAWDVAANARASRRNLTYGGS
jgi:predicted DNA-binding transcriptional regulator AlpA